MCVCILKLFFFLALFNIFSVIVVHHCRIIANGFQQLQNASEIISSSSNGKGIPVCWRGVCVNFIKFFVSHCDCFCHLGLLFLTKIEMFVVCSLEQRMNSINVRILSLAWQQLTEIPFFGDCVFYLRNNDHRFRFVERADIWCHRYHCRTVCAIAFTAHTHTQRSQTKERCEFLERVFQFQPHYL